MGEAHFTCSDQLGPCPYGDRPIRRIDVQRHLSASRDCHVARQGKKRFYLRDCTTNLYLVDEPRCTWQCDGEQRRGNCKDDSRLDDGESTWSAGHASDLSDPMRCSSIVTRPEGSKITVVVLLLHIIQPKRSPRMKIEIEYCTL